ncbi:MAG: hypothetical protein ONB44_24420 [candidate division KSB1 bacterium]|nr:hypothetical protein [candidate division KSB1 bacterium]
MTTTIAIKLKHELLDFVERYARQVNRQPDEIIAEAIELLRLSRELEQGYLDDRQEALAFAESALPLFSEVKDEISTAR